MNILITAATSAEWGVIVDACRKESSIKHRINFHTSGVGAMATTYALTSMPTLNYNDLVIQVGIAGSYSFAQPLADVLLVEKEYMASVGVEEQARWLDIFDMQLHSPVIFPFQEKALVNPLVKEWNKINLPIVNAVSVDYITASENRIALLQNKYAPSIESMEGASFHYVCLQRKVPFLQIRALSNYVGDRNKQNWQIAAALENLSKATVELLKAL